MRRGGMYWKDSRKVELILTSPKMSTCSTDESAEVPCPVLLVDRSCAEAGAATGCTQTPGEVPVQPELGSLSGGWGMLVASCWPDWVPQRLHQGWCHTDSEEQERGGEVCLQLTSQPTCSKAKADLSIHFLFIACPAFSCKVVKLKTRVLFMLPLLSGCWHGLLLPPHQPAQGTELHLLWFGVCLFLTSSCSCRF